MSSSSRASAASGAICLRPAGRGGRARGGGEREARDLVAVGVDSLYCYTPRRSAATPVRVAPAEACAWMAQAAMERRLARAATGSSAGDANASSAAAARAHRPCRCGLWMADGGRVGVRSQPEPELEAKANRIARRNATKQVPAPQAPKILGRAFRAATRPPRHRRKDPSATRFL